jgi:hypothetical protein
VSENITAVAKCQVHEEANEQVLVTFAADYQDERNKEWAKYTPALSVSITVLPEVAAKYVDGARYFIHFEHADD